MSGETPKAPRGTHDVLPEEADRRRRIETIAQRVLEDAGYRRIETPIFEATELFARGVGGSTDVVQKEMYSFQDRGERDLTLRPEGTAGVARAYLEHGMHKLPQPVRLWYWGPYFRYERAQKGRQRQFWQFGAEALGSDDPALDAEGIVLLHRILDQVLRSGATDRLSEEQRANPETVTAAQDAAVAAAGLRLRIGSLGSLEGRAAYRELLVAHLRAHEERLTNEIRGRIDLNPLRAFDSDDPSTQAVMADAPRLLDHLTPEDTEHFAEVRALLDQAGIAYEVDPTLVRGLDYYSRTLFEFTSDALGAQSGVGGGGRYDGLAEQLGGPSTPACGWGAGVERVLLCLGDAPGTAARPFAYVVWPEGRRREAFALATALQAQGHGTQLDLAGRGMKGQRRRAERSGARHLVTVNDDGTVAVRRYADGREEDVPDVTAAVALLQRWAGEREAPPDPSASPLPPRR